MEKSGGTPYAMVYAQDSHIESFAYPYYLKTNEGEELLGIGQSEDYNLYIPSGLFRKIVHENKELHDFILKKKTTSMVQVLTHTREKLVFVEKMKIDLLETTKKLDYEIQNYRTDINGLKENC